jgi:hypothetical protein
MATTKAKRAKNQSLGLIINGLVRALITGLTTELAMLIRGLHSVLPTVTLDGRGRDHTCSERN